MRFVTPTDIVSCTDQEVSCSVPVNAIMPRLFGRCLNQSAKWITTVLSNCSVEHAHLHHTFRMVQKPVIIIIIFLSVQRVTITHWTHFPRFFSLHNIPSLSAFLMLSLFSEYPCCSLLFLFFWPDLSPSLFSLSTIFQLIMGILSLVRLVIFSSPERWRSTL